MRLSKAGAALRKFIESHNTAEGKRGGAKVAKLLGGGCDQSALSRWSTGQRKPGIAFAIRIQSVLGIPIGDWLVDADS